MFWSEPCSPCFQVSRNAKKGAVLLASMEKSVKSVVAEKNGMAETLAATEADLESAGRGGCDRACAQVLSLTPCIVYVRVGG